jgi:nucleoside-diphosphate-sugar epimerase
VDDSIITTAIDGVLNVFKAAAAPDSIVKRIVLTSSIVAIAGRLIDLSTELNIIYQ